MPSDSPPPKQTANLPAKRGRGRPRGSTGKAYIGKFSRAEVKEALSANFGNVMEATAALNQAEMAAGGTRSIASETVRFHMKRWVMEDGLDLEQIGRRNLLDFAEQTVIRAMRNNDTRSARWLLEQLGKDRGYGKGGLLPGGLKVIDPADLTDDQLRVIFDPANLSDRQMDVILEVLMSRMGPKAGPIIDAETIS
jgi:hypothetical protein